MSAESDPLIAPKNPPVRVPLTFEKVLAAAAMAALCLITLGNVIARYLTNYSFAFTEEFSIALMVVVTLLGAGIATAADRQIRIVFFTGLLPRTAEKIAEVIASLATIAMFGLLVWLGARLVWDEYRFEVTSPGLGEPQWIYTLALPLLSLAVIARALGHLIRTLRSRRRPAHDVIEPL
ncbi:TRAP transporter small permease [Rhodoplanes azumiensis]|uniref:TRAP transporter small permease protein n=1 Tax=Rhodoplanes azumiensis TaxID=1897628 RepID=A0ABW5AII5_9BRAD